MPIPPPPYPPPPYLRFGPLPPAPLLLVLLPPEVIFGPPDVASPCSAPPDVFLLPFLEPRVRPRYAPDPPLLLPRLSELRLCDCARVGDAMWFDWIWETDETVR